MKFKLIYIPAMLVVVALSTALTACNGDQKAPESTDVPLTSKDSGTTIPEVVTSPLSTTGDTGTLNKSTTVTDTKKEKIVTAKDNVITSVATTAPSVVPPPVNTTPATKNEPPAKVTPPPTPVKNPVVVTPSKVEPTPVVQPTTSGTGKWVVPSKAINTTNPVAVNNESLTTGKMLFQKHCASCHGKGGLGDGSKAAQLKTELVSFRLPVVQNQTDGSFFYKIREGKDDMPAFKKKIPDEEEVWSIVNYIRTLK